MRIPISFLGELKEFVKFNTYQESLKDYQNLLNEILRKIQRYQDEYYEEQRAFRQKEIDNLCQYCGEPAITAETLMQGGHPCKAKF